MNTSTNLRQAPVLADMQPSLTESPKSRSRLRKLWRSDRGVAGIEAALIIPLMVFIIIGTMELYQYFRAAAVLNRAAFTLADGVAMQRELFAGGACDKSDSICTYGAIAPDLMTPLDFASNGWLIISAYSATEPAKGPNPPPVTWENAAAWVRQYAGSGTGGAAPASQLDPSSEFPTANEGDTLIVVEVFYDFVPFALSANFWEALAGSRRMYSRAFLRPRFADLRELS